jgi:hypothetical protein
MSGQPQSYAFPQRAPVFTAVVVLAGLALFGWFVHRLYHPAPPVNPLALANPADFSADERWMMTPAGRAQHLAELRAHEQAEATTYGWIDRKAGIVRVPIDRAIELTVRDHEKK